MYGAIICLYCFRSNANRVRLHLGLLLVMSLTEVQETHFVSLSSSCRNDNDAE